MNSVLITGANRGIGLGLVKALIRIEKVPKFIIATCRKPEETSELQELSQNHKNIKVVQLDLLNFDAYGEFAKKIKDILQTDGLNVLINNAGIAQKFLRIEYLKNDPMTQSFVVNTTAPLIMTKELLPLLKQASENNKDQPMGSQRAAVVNISSILGSIAKNDEGGFYPYRCSKAALNAGTKSLSIDLRPHNILATCIHPGWVKTRMGGPKAPLEVDNACKMIVDTILNLSSKHNGAFYSYDGKELEW